MTVERKSVKRYRQISISIVLLLVILILGEVWCSTHWLIVRNYEYQSEKL